MAWVEVLVFFIAVILHELGHLAAFLWIVKRWPPIKVTWFGSIYMGGDEKYLKNVTVRQMAFIAYTGIFTGFVYLTLVAGEVFIPMMLVYFFVSLQDLTLLLQFYQNKKLRDTKIGDIVIVNLSKYKVVEI